MNTERKQEEGDPRAGGQPQILPVLGKKELCSILSPFLFSISQKLTLGVFLAESSIALLSAEHECSSSTQEDCILLRIHEI